MIFPFTDVLASEAPTILKKFVSKEAQLWRPPFWNCTWQPGLFKWCHSASTQNWQEAEKPATDLTSFTSSGKCIFSKLSASPSGLAPNNMAWEQPLHTVIKVKRLVGRYRQNPLHRMMSRKRSQAADYCSKWSQHVEFWTSLKTNFTSLGKPAL